VTLDELRASLDRGGIAVRPADLHADAEGHHLRVLHAWRHLPGHADRTTDRRADRATHGAADVSSLAARSAALLERRPLYPGLPAFPSFAD